MPYDSDVKLVTTDQIVLVFKALVFSVMLWPIWMHNHCRCTSQHLKLSEISFFRHKRSPKCRPGDLLKWKLTRWSFEDEAFAESSVDNWGHTQWEECLAIDPFSLSPSFSFTLLYLSALLFDLHSCINQSPTSLWNGTIHIQYMNTITPNISV